jgi:23S rRNA (guanosine2251-2'-O)-methyltransferase
VATEFLYGRNAVLESLRAARRRNRRLLVADNLQHDERLDEIARRADAASLVRERVPRPALDELAPAGHQGVVLETSRYPYAESVLPHEPSSASILLAFDELEDPRNVGALIRTAEAAGVEGIVLPERRSVEITPAVVNASSGAVEHMAVVIEKNLARWISAARVSGYWIIGLDGGDDAENLFDADVPMPAVVVIGSEGRGLRRLTREHCDMLVKIPMYGRVESLNASAAGSIALYQIREYAT